MIQSSTFRIGAQNAVVTLFKSGNAGRSLTIPQKNQISKTA